jgi:hypothetical protein
VIVPSKAFGRKAGFPAIGGVLTSSGPDLTENVANFSTKRELRTSHDDCCSQNRRRTEYFSISQPPTANSGIAQRS